MDVQREDGRASACSGCGSTMRGVHKWPPRAECRRPLHDHCDWPRCACWCGAPGVGTRPHPDGGHRQYWGPNTPDGAGDGYPPRDIEAPRHLGRHIAGGES